VIGNFLKNRDDIKMQQSVRVQAAKVQAGVQAVVKRICQTSCVEKFAKLLLLPLFITAGCLPPSTPPEVTLPRLGLENSEIGVVINSSDPQSVTVGEAFVSARKIPTKNVVYVSFAPSAVMSKTVFATIKSEVDAALGAGVQGLALSWTQPYRVDCMSVTSAFTLGFDAKYCSVYSNNSCSGTARSPYYNSDSSRPFTDLGMRPAIMLAGATVNDALALINRGVAADNSLPAGKGFFVRTTDANRSVRWPDFTSFVSGWNPQNPIAMNYVDNSSGAGSNAISNESAVMFYHTGLAQVSNIATNTYLPGALADHLTSWGGVVPTGPQMSVTEWISAGVTGSYGTVMEPCAYEQKFPRVSTLIPHYMRGETLLEAYWKSVQWPGEGLFVGEPLAKPWRLQEVEFDQNTQQLSIHTNAPKANERWAIASASASNGPWSLQQVYSADNLARQTFVLANATSPYYKLDTFANLSPTQREKYQALEWVYAAVVSADGTVSVLERNAFLPWMVQQLGALNTFEQSLAIEQFDSRALEVEDFFGFFGYADTVPLILEIANNAAENSVLLAAVHVAAASDPASNVHESEVVAAFEQLLAPAP